MRKRTKITLLIYSIAVVLYTGIDYLIHSDLYRYGLQYDDFWFWKSQILYFVLYQVLLLALYFYNRNWRLMLVLEIFTITGGPDLIFFSLWDRMSFPNGDWTWMLMYKLLGRWTTMMQVMLTGACTAIAVLVAHTKRS